MSKRSISIDFEYDYDFLLFGVCSPMKDYTICYHLNKFINCNFTRADEDISLDYEDAIEKAFFSLYEYWNEQYQNQWYLIANKCRIQCSENQQNQGTIFDGFIHNRLKTKLLIPENLNVDYYILIHGIYSESSKQALLKNIKSINRIVSIHEINITDLKSKENLII